MYGHTDGVSDQCRAKHHEHGSLCSSVIMGLPNNVNRNTVMKNVVGPSSVEPVRTASQLKNPRTGNSRNMAHPTHVKKTHRAVKPDEAFTRAILNASKVQPTTSLAIPALSTTTPTVVSRSLSSEARKTSHLGEIAHSRTSQNATQHWKCRNGKSHANEK
jgi:hypothetical protein